MKSPVPLLNPGGYQTNRVGLLFLLHNKITYKISALMKMALSDFALRKKGIYGILHVIILLLSLFLVISISIDTFLYPIGLYESSAMDLCLISVRFHSRVVSFEK